jgi:hypothetical protein
VRTIRNTQIYCAGRIYSNSVRTSQETHYVSTTKPNRLMLFRETVAVYCENHTEHTNTLCGQNVESLDVTTNGKYSYHCGIKDSYTPQCFSQIRRLAGTQARIGAKTRELLNLSRFVASTITTSRGRTQLVTPPYTAVRQCWGGGGGTLAPC